MKKVARISKGVRGLSAKKGFTLIEIIVVIVIIAILAGIAVPNVGRYLTSAKLTNALTDANMLASAINMYNSTVFTDANKIKGTPPVSVVSGKTVKDLLVEGGFMPSLKKDIDVVEIFIFYDYDETTGDGTKLYKVVEPLTIDIVNTADY